jgi:Arylsulfotransferase (ASST)
MNMYNTGTVRLDRCSNIVWLLQQPTHHSLEQTWDGNLIVSSHEEYGREWVPERFRVDPAPDEGFYYNQAVKIVSQEGEVLRSIPVLEAIHRSGWDALLVAGSAGGELFENRVNLLDPLHLNDSEVLSPAMADAFPLFEAGDIMVSFRRPSFILVLDGETGDVKWGTGGQFHMQHDPDFLPNGHILIYDNRVTVDDRGRRGRPLEGSSRVIEMDPVTQRIVWSYDGAPDHKFYAYARGISDQLPNGNVLITDPEEGRVFELARSAGDRIVWDYVNLIEPKVAGMLIDARRYPADHVRFLDQSCPAVASN